MDDHIQKKNILKYAIPIFCLVLGVILLIVGFNRNESNEKVINPLFVYDVEKDASYVVNLRKNSFYEEETLTTGTKFPAFVIDSFNTSFTYALSSRVSTDYSYTYNIVAEISAKVEGSNDNEEIWHRDYLLLEDKQNFDFNTGTFLINENVDIDFQRYNDLAQLFEQNSGFSMDIKLKVKLNVITNINSDTLSEEEKTIYDSIELDIPLASSLAKIEKNYEEKQTKEIYPEGVEKTDEKHLINLSVITGTILIVIGVMSFVIYYLTRTISQEQRYHKNINSITKDYADLIVTVSNKPQLDGLRRMKVTKFEDLVDVAEQNHANIIHYERQRNKESDMFVITDRYYYLYIVTSDDLE